MRIGTIVVAALGGLVLAGMVDAAQKPAAADWVGAWGYVGAPSPPGAAAPVSSFFAPPAVIPLGALGPVSPPAPPRTIPPPLLDNPGNVAIDNSTADLTNVTVREVVRVSIGGGKLRLRFSNEGGVDPLTLRNVHVAAADSNGRIMPGTDREVHFSGQAGVIVPAGAPILSDPVDLATKSLQKLYVSVYLPGSMPARASRTLFEYVAGEPGDFTASTDLPQVQLRRVPSLLSLVEVQPDKPASVVVTLGDSITEGTASTANAFRGWPDQLAERLAGRGWAVVNAGIAGNRLLRYGAGPSVLARLDRDVLSVPGVKAVILLEGINDIGVGLGRATSTEAVTAEALEAADLQVVARAHEHGIRVIGATLTPYQGSAYSSPAGETVREALNTWIRTSGVFDGVIDFSAVVADPENPLTFAKAYNDRDHLHPNDTGYKAIADAIDLALITGN